MNRTLKVISILLYFLLISSLSFAGEFKVVRVYDGDSITAKTGEKKIKVRLVGIDAPEKSRKKHELGQPFSQKATEYLASLVLNKTITIKEYGTDRYGRILGLVFINGTNVNLEMVKTGLAEVYRGRHAKGFDPKIYQDAEAEAVKEKRGMWVQGDKYISPRDWRRGRRN
jgi:endonuclease YncB( thermonuclease family)